MAEKGTQNKHCIASIARACCVRLLAFFGGGAHVLEYLITTGCIELMVTALTRMMATTAYEDR